MKVTPLELAGPLRIEPTVHADERGFFIETYRKGRYAEHGITAEFVQDSHSQSKQNVIRGLKFQFDRPTDKLVRVASGTVFAVAVDIRPDSPTLGKYVSLTLSDENHHQLYVPFGFAFGFCATSASADVLYKLSAEHSDAGSGTIRWNDPTIAIAWPTEAPIVTEKDNGAPTLEEWLAAPEAAHFKGIQ